MGVGSSDRSRHWQPTGTQSKPTQALDGKYPSWPCAALRKTTRAHWTDTASDGMALTLTSTNVSAGLAPASSSQKGTHHHPLLRARAVLGTHPIEVSNADPPLNATVGSPVPPALEMRWRRRAGRSASDPDPIGRPRHTRSTRYCWRHIGRTSRCDAGWVLREAGRRRITGSRRALCSRALAPSFVVSVTGMASVG
jgi:hypothetical protein